MGVSCGKTPIRIVDRFTDVSGQARIGKKLVAKLAPLLALRHAKWRASAEPGEVRRRHHFLLVRDLSAQVTRAFRVEAFYR